MKRYLADRYANTNIMKPEILDGISDHARDFLNQCMQGCSSAQGYADIYVGTLAQEKRGSASIDTDLGASSLFCP